VTADVAPGEMLIDPILKDDVLLRKSAKGDEEAFVQLYRRYQAPLFRFALRMTGNRWAAEEVVQDVFITLMRDPKKFDVERGTLGGYLYGIARNRIMKHQERLPRELPLDPEVEEGNTPLARVSDEKTPAQWVELKQRREMVRDAVMQLPVEFREAIVLCELEELSYEEAANALECPIGTIRSRLHRGRALLLAKLEILRDVPKRVSAGR
jgi:RNA polymerase sigma-70 factor (ECF subfamily)